MLRNNLVDDAMTEPVTTNNLIEHNASGVGGLA